MPPSTGLSVNVGAGTRANAPAAPQTWAHGETKGGFGRDRSSSRGSRHSPGSPSHRKRAGRLRSPSSPKGHGSPPLSPSKADPAAHVARKKSLWGKVAQAKTNFAVARTMSKQAAAAAKRRWRTILQKTRTLAALPSRQVDQLVEHLTERVYESGDYIIKRGTKAQELFVIDRGRVSVRCPASQQAPGQSATFKTAAEADAEPTEEINQVTDGGVIGEIALIADVPRTADCVAVGRVVTLVLSREHFNHALAGKLQPVNDSAAADHLSLSIKHICIAALHSGAAVD